MRANIANFGKRRSMAQTSIMAREAAEAARLCEDQVARNAELMRDAGERLRRLDAPFAATLARGSSDQAAAFAKTLFETRAATPTLSHSPSIGSIYDATSPRFRGVPLFAISQSGRSPDLLRAAERAKAQGATIVAVVNDAMSPLADLADLVLPVHAGPEKSVAATKSFLTTLVALSHLTAEWSGDAALLDAVRNIGSLLRAAQAENWSEATLALAAAENLLVLGRGFTLPIAGEAALKLKETSGLHAEAFSVAEVAHGPMTLVEATDPVLVFGPLDQARAGVRERIADFADRGALVIAAGHEEDIGRAAIRLPSPAGRHPVLGAIAYIQSFYGLAEAVARARGRDPDQPPHLSKVTKTL